MSESSTRHFGVFFRITGLRVGPVYRDLKRAIEVAANKAVAHGGGFEVREKVITWVVVDARSGGAK